MWASPSLDSSLVPSPIPTQGALPTSPIIVTVGTGRGRRIQESISQPGLAWDRVESECVCLRVCVRVCSLGMTVSFGPVLWAPSSPHTSPLSEVYLVSPLGSAHLSYSSHFFGNVGLLWTG